MILLTACFYFLGFVQNVAVGNFGDFSRLQITHSHAHMHCEDCAGHHHDNLDPDSTEHDEGSEPVGDTNSHTHDLASSAGPSGVVQQSVGLVFHAVQLPALGSIPCKSPAQDAGLASIFRPPIA